MGFNFSNPFELIQKFSQFKSFLSQSQKDPKQLLIDEMKRRNMSESEINQMIQTANQLKNILGVK